MLRIRERTERDLTEKDRNEWRRGETSRINIDYSLRVNTGRFGGFNPGSSFEDFQSRQAALANLDSLSDQQIDARIRAADQKRLDEIQGLFHPRKPHIIPHKPKPAV
jgi:hypothetical protein